MLPQGGRAAKHFLSPRRRLAGCLGDPYDLGMAGRFVDLHTHSTASDGTLAPAKLVRLAGELGLSGLALTDHDTVAGLAEAAGEARQLNIAFLPAIEISCIYPPPGTMHLLGYGIDPASPVLARMMKRLIDARDDRNPKIVQRLQELGVKIDMDEVRQAAGGQVIGRPHIAAVLVRKGYVKSLHQAFAKYLGQGAAAWFDKERLTSAQAIRLIRQSGGVAALAHPIQLAAENDSQLRLAVRTLVDQGMQALEVLHSDHDDAHVDKYTRLASRLGLLKTGGSDFHGDYKNGVELGRANGKRVPMEWMEAIAATAKR